MDTHADADAGDDRQQHAGGGGVGGHLGQEDGDRGDTQNGQHPVHAAEKGKSVADPDRESALFETVRQGEAAAKQDDDLPGHPQRAFPVEQKDPLSEVERDDEQQQGPQHGDDRILQGLDGCKRDHALEQPQRGHAAEDPKYPALGRGERAQGLQFRLDDRGAGLDPWKFTGQGDAGEIEPAAEEHHRSQRKAEQEPLNEADLDAEQGLEHARQHGVGRGADQGRHTADGGCVGDTQHQRGGEPGSGVQVWPCRSPPWR